MPRTLQEALKTDCKCGEGHTGQDHLFFIQGPWCSKCPCKKFIPTDA